MSLSAVLDQLITLVIVLLEGILFVVRTGIRWNDLPTSAFGVSGVTCWRRLKEWHEAGVAAAAREPAG